MAVGVSSLKLAGKVFITNTLGLAKRLANSATGIPYLERIL